MLKRLALTTGLIATTLAAPLFADPFDPKVVPADAKWVIHVDADAVVASSFWPMVQKRIDTNGNVQNQIRQFEELAGMNFPQDLHSITLFGVGFDEADGVVLVRAKVNQDQLMGMLQMNEAFASDTTGKHEIVSWTDNGKTMYGAFFSTDQCVVAQHKENVAKALEALDGTGQTIKADSFLAAPTGTGVLAGIAGDGLAQLAKRDKNNPVLRNMKSAWLTIAQQGTNVTLKGTFSVGDEKKAQQMKAAAEGFRAMGLMLAGDENADPKLKAIAPLLPAAQVSSEGTNVVVNWTVPFEQVKQLAEQVAAGRKNKAATTTP